MSHTHTKATLGEPFADCRRFISVAEIVVDIGCGIKQQKIWNPYFTFYVEPHKPYIEILASRVQATRCMMLNMTWQKALDFFPENSVDSVCIFDVVEHVQKDDALALIERTKKIVRQQLLIFTPLGFLEQHAHDVDAWAMDGGDYQEHVSGWEAADLPGFRTFTHPNLHGEGKGALLGIWSKWASSGVP